MLRQPWSSLKIEPISLKERLSLAESAKMEQSNPIIRKSYSYAPDSILQMAFRGLIISKWHHQILQWYQTHWETAQGALGVQGQEDREGRTQQKGQRGQPVDIQVRVLQPAEEGRECGFRVPKHWKPEHGEGQVRVSPNPGGGRGGQLGVQAGRLQGSQRKSQDSSIISFEDEDHSRKMIVNVWTI